MAVRSFHRLLLLALALALLAAATLLLTRDPRTESRQIALPQDGQDVTAALQAAIDAAPDGVLLRLPAGRFSLEGTIVIRDRVGLVLEGSSPETTVFYASRRGELGEDGLSWRRHFLVLGGSDVALRGLHVQGANRSSGEVPGYAEYVPEYEHEHGFAFVGVDGAVLEHSSVEGVYGDGVYVGNDGHDLDPAEASANVRLSQVSLEWVGRQGIGITHAKGVLLDGVRMHARLSGVLLEPNSSSQYVKEVEVRNSRVRAALVPFAAAGAGEASDIWIHHNTAESPGAWPMVSHEMTGGRSRGWRVEDNTLLGSLQRASGTGMKFQDVRDVSIRRNTLPFDADSELPAVLFTGATGSLDVAHNRFLGAARVFTSENGSGPVESRENVLSAQG